MKKVFFILIFYNLIFADIILSGKLHPGDNQDNIYTPIDPLTKSTQSWWGRWRVSREHTYDYYKNNPSRFYLTEDINLTGVKLINEEYFENNSNLRVWIDGNLVYTGPDGATDVNFTAPITLQKGMHTIAVTGSCYYSDLEISCDDYRVDDIDDFIFDGILLKTSATTDAYNFIERHHTGDTEDSDDDYDIDETVNSYYPDMYEAPVVEYLLNLNKPLRGFRIFLSRIRDVHEKGINKINVYDINNNLVLSYDINHSNTSTFDINESFNIEVNGISHIDILSGEFTAQSQYTGLDDLSWDEFIFIPYFKSSQISKTYKFDAWDVFRDINDRNISTKIASKDFNLTIVSLDENGSDYQDFNGTVCVRVISNTFTSNWQKILFNSESEKNESFNINRAIKSARVNIEWKQDEDVNCPINDGNESNSSDNFAIRPKEFKITNIPTHIKAGKEFNITIKALDYNGNPTKDYNESIHTDTTVKLEANISKSGCKNGNLEIVKGSSFKDGEANVTLKYSEVGDINISIKEVNTSEFAEVDEDDTNMSFRFIKEANKTISISPHHFEINSKLINFDKDNNFTYLDDNVSKIYALLDINITAKNEKNETTQNYNEKCFAKDINISVNKDILQSDINVSKLKYFYKDAKEKISKVFEIDKDKNISIDYKDSNFTTEHNGSTNISIYINFDRNFSKPSNPFEVNVSEINVTDGEVNGSELNIGKVRFYYGNLLVDDVETAKNKFDIEGKFVIYDNRENDNLIPNNSKEIEYNWWENTFHKEDDGNISDDEIVVSKDYNASDSNGVSVKVNVDNGEKLIFHIDRNGDTHNFVVVHLLSPNFSHLWYSKYNKPYDISNNSTCFNHFCFSISWNNSNNGYVGSGDFNGTESNITEVNSTKTGVKIFR